MKIKKIRNKLLPWHHKGAGQELLKKTSYAKKRNLIVIIIVLLVGILVGSLTKPGKEIIKYFEKDAPLYLVEEVIDGDTIVINEERIMNNEELNNNEELEKVLVRLIGINAPERSTCYYNESKKALEDLILNKTVRLEKDISGLDKFDRWLRYVILPSTDPEHDDLLINDYLVREGFALAEPYEPDVRHRKLLYEAQDEAMDNLRGIWAKCDYKPVNEQDNELDLEPERAECNIKGNVGRGADAEKIYFLSHCQNYNRVMIDPRKGDTYFCTEEEAVEAGFRKVGNCE